MERITEGIERRKIVKMVLVYSVNSFGMMSSWVSNFSCMEAAGRLKIHSSPSRSLAVFDSDRLQ